jgi:leader peptidase (prepilin peptidase)/N-methyltransferase
MPIALIAGVFGAIFGSFFNVVAYRLPRGESLSRPPSHCTSCGAAIRVYDNVPILGWLWLRGRCRSCAEKIPIRYPIVELLTAALAVSVVLARHTAISRVLGLALIAVLVPVSLIDLDTRKIPNKITAPAAVLAVAIGLVLKPSGVPAQLLAGLLGGGFLLVFAMAYPRGLGMGDVKLAGVLGLYLIGSVAVALFAGILVAAAVGIGVMARVGVAKGRKVGIPFGPFLAVGGVLGILAGPQLLHWYLHTLGH